MKKYQVDVTGEYILHAVDGCSRTETPNCDGWTLACGVGSIEEAANIIDEYVRNNPSEFVPGNSGIGAISYVYVECYEYDDEDEFCDEFKVLEYMTEDTLTEEHYEAFDNALCSYRRWCDYESDHYYTIEAFLEDEEF